jgi:two-component sensor histidine kinase
VVLHKHLYAEDDLRLVNLRDYLGELAATIHDLLDDQDRDRIRLEIDLPPIRIDIDRAVPLALVVAEVITNAFKYAFPDQRHGVVALRCRVFDGDLELTVSDDGVGHPEGAEDGGLGAHLMHGFARQLGGRLTMESGDSGTRVRLVFARSVDPRHAAAPQPAAQAGI